MRGYASTRYRTLQPGGRGVKVLFNAHAFGVQGGKQGEGIRPAFCFSNFEPASGLDRIPSHATSGEMQLAERRGSALVPSFRRMPQPIGSLRASVSRMVQEQ